MITIFKRIISARNDHNFGYRVDEAYLDVENWTVSRVTGSTNRKGNNLSKTTRMETPEQHGITRDTVISRDVTVDKSDYKFSLRIYYSESGCSIHQVYPAGYMFSEIPKLPYKTILLNNDINVKSLTSSLEHVLKIVALSDISTPISQSTLNENASLNAVFDDLEIAKKHGLLDLVDYLKVEAETGFKTYDEINKIVQENKKKRDKQLAIEREIAYKKYAEEREKRAIDVHNEVINQINNSELNEFIYAIKNGSLRAFSFPDYMLEVKSYKLSSDQRDSGKSYYKVIEEGEVNGFKYKDICLLNFGGLDMLNRVSWDFSSILSSYNLLGIIERLL